MSSRRLSRPTFDRLTRWVSDIEEALQADASAVESAQEEHPSFGAGWVQSDLTRAVIAYAARGLGGSGLVIHDLGRGGTEGRIVHKRIEQRFRLKHAHKDGDGNLKVTVSSDSLLAKPPANLWSDDVQQWVIAYLIDPKTLTFSEVWVAEVVGVTGNSLLRLTLADEELISHTAPLPSDFRPEQTDLDLGDEDERGEERG